MGIREIVHAKSQILGCSKCDLRTLCKSPVPLSIDKVAGCRLLFVGEAPGPQEDVLGTPFIGPSGKLLREIIEEAELHEVPTAYCNVISCFPHNADSRKVRAPKDQEITNCRGNLVAQIRAADPEVIVTVGAVATKAWRSDVKVTKHHGRMGRWRLGSAQTGVEYPVMPIVHPSTILRGFTGYRKQIQDDLLQVRDVLCYGMPPEAFGWDRCIRCEVKAETQDLLDLDLIAYCRQHRKKWEKEAEKQRREWDRVLGGLTKSGQATLL